MNKLSLMALGIAMCLVCVSCTNKEDVIAKIGSQKITSDMLVERITATPPAYQSYLSTEQGKKQFVDLIIREKVILESAKNAGINKRQEYRQAVEEFKQEQKRQLKDYEDGLVMEMYLKDLQINTMNVTEQEVDQYYETNKTDYQKPLAIVAKHILLPSKEEAEVALDRIKNGEKFDKVAKEMSTDKVSAQKGGLIGPFRKGELIEEFENAVFNLKKGEMSGIVESPYGMHIIVKVSEEQLRPIPEDLAKSEIRKILEKEKFEKWFENAKIKFNVNPDYSKLENIKYNDFEDSSIQEEEIDTEIVE